MHLLLLSAYRTLASLASAGGAAARLCERRAKPPKTSSVRGRQYQTVRARFFPLVRKLAQARARVSPRVSTLRRTEGFRTEAPCVCCRYQTAYATAYASLTLLTNLTCCGLTSYAQLTQRLPMTCFSVETTPVSSAPRSGKGHPAGGRVEPPRLDAPARVARGC